MRASQHAARGTFRLHERRHGFAEILERGVCVLEEMRNRPTSDGHDQGPLRRVLWRRRDVLYDLAPNVQCRRCTKRYGVDPCDYLAWHSHRPKRLQVFTNRTLACGFRDDRLARR